MGTFAAVMTGKGTGAISTVMVFGDGAETIVGGIFRSCGVEPACFAPGRVLLGAIVDGERAIDQVTIGCEDIHTVAIHCHGNPLIVEMIMELLGRHGVELTDHERLLTGVLTAAKGLSTIAVEGKIAQAKARTLEGTRIIANQIEAGLDKELSRWHQRLDETPLEQIKSQARQILDDSIRARLIIDGCTVVIAGPPNSGKSTLFNQLCGTQKAIVTDVRGTTRDWVSARCRIGPFSVELIDTAGLDQTRADCRQVSIEQASQLKTVEILRRADMVLLVLDNSGSGDQLDQELLAAVAGGKILAVLNKSDLPGGFDAVELPQKLCEPVPISAKLGTGIEKLVEKIPRLLGVDDFDLKTPVCFTERQVKLLTELLSAESSQQAGSIITGLLNGEIVSRPGLTGNERPVENK